MAHPQFLQWSFQHAREIVPTARISRGSGPLGKLTESLQPLADLPVTPPGAPATTVGAVLATTYTDGFLVLHDAAVVAEEYPGGMGADTLHLLMSVTKSVVGAVAAVLADRGQLDLAAPVTRYVAALAASGYAGATVRQVLDMRSGVIFSEDYTDPQSGIRKLRQCVGWNAHRDPAAPASIYDFLLTLRQGSPHGGAFAYRSCEADVLGWVCEQAAGGRRMPDLISELLWSRLAVEHDADISIDASGVAVHDGGMSATMRDVARFAHMLAQDGRSATGEQVLPEWWVRDSLTGDPDSRDAFAASPTLTGMPGGMYRNQLWVPYPDSSVLLCLGIHGQLVYVNPAARTVGVKLSSWPVPQDPVMLAATLEAFSTIARHLQAGR